MCLSLKFCIVNLCLTYFVCCIYLSLFLNMPDMVHDWINKSVLFYSILFKLSIPPTAELLCGVVIIFLDLHFRSNPLMNL